MIRFLRLTFLFNHRLFFPWQNQRQLPTYNTVWQLLLRLLGIFHSTNVDYIIHMRCLLVILPGHHEWLVRQDEENSLKHWCCIRGIGIALWVTHSRRTRRASCRFCFYLRARTFRFLSSVLLGIQHTGEALEFFRIKKIAQNKLFYFCAQSLQKKFFFCGWFDSF